MKRVPIKQLPWLTFEDMVIMKLVLVGLFLAIYVVPPQWKEITGTLSNIFWLWKVR